MLQVFWKPKEMSETLEKVSWSITVLYLVISAVILFFAAKILKASWLNSLYVGIGLIVLAVLGALALNIILWVLGKNNFHNALKVLILPWFIMSVGLFIVSVISLIPVVGAVLGGLFTLYFVPLTIMVQLKSVMASFKLDLLTTLVVLFVLYISAATVIINIIGALALQMISKLGFGLLPINFP